MSSLKASVLKVRSVSYSGATLTFLVLLAAAAAAQEREPPIDHARAAVFFEEARALEAASPWASPLYGPILFVEPESRYVVANEPDPEGALRDMGGVFVGTLPQSEGIANTAVSWIGKRWTMLVWPLPRGYFERRRLIGHELFHRLGPELGIPMASPANAHLDTAEGRLGFRLELRALARALASSGTERQKAVEDALAFRIRRHEAFPEGAVEERALELNEGLAEYTGIRVSLPEGSRAGWAVQRMESREVQAARGGVTRNFAYATGPGYGLLLDAAVPGWHETVNESSDFGVLLAQAYGVELDDALVADSRLRMTRYDGTVLEAFESAREAARAREQAEFRARYLEEPVLTLPVDEEFGYSFNPNRVAALDGVGQVYATAEVRGGWGTMDVSGGVLMKRSERGVTAVVVPAPTDPEARPVSGDGWTLVLLDGWEIARGERAGDWVVQRIR
jgi:hypothetical protein